MARAATTAAVRKVRMVELLFNVSPYYNGAWREQVPITGCGVWFAPISVCRFRAAGISCFAPQVSKRTQCVMGLRVRLVYRSSKTAWAESCELTFALAYGLLAERLSEPTMRSRKVCAIPW